MGNPARLWSRRRSWGGFAASGHPLCFSDLGGLGLCESPRELVELKDGASVEIASHRCGTHPPMPCHGLSASLSGQRMSMPEPGGRTVNVRFVYAVGVGGAARLQPPAPWHNRLERSCRP